MIQSQANQTRTGQNNGVVMSLIQFSKAGIQVAAQVLHFQIGTQVQQLALAPETAGPHGGLWGELRQAGKPIGQKGIPRIFSGGDGAQAEALGKNSGKVLETMDSQIDLATKQGLFDFLCKYPFAPKLVQGSLGVSIAGGADHLDDYWQQRVGLAQPAFDEICLPQGKRAAS
jgi:hypothetical protein